MQRWLRGTASAVVLLLLFQAAIVGGSAIGEQVFVPIGGGYSEEALQGFGEVVIEHANPEDGTVDIFVVPATYGDDPAIRQENIELATQRAQQIEDACNAVVDTNVFGGGCDATLLHIFDSNDTHNQANADAFDDPDLDGTFMLGGDQTIAMRILADSPVEAAIADAFERGVVFGGTSAGAAVQSRTMLAGYTSSGWPYNAFERNQIVIWWDNDADATCGAGPAYERGLTFGSDGLFTDQHYYQRGRITRSLNTVAQSDLCMDESLLGLGVDYATGVSFTDSTIAGVFGASSVMIIDGETASATFEFKPPRDTLSASNVLTHILAPGHAVSFDVEDRTATVDGIDQPFSQPGAWDGDTLDKPGDGDLILGGDLSFDFAGPAMQAFYSRAVATGNGRIAIVASGAKNSGQAQTLGNEYAKALKDLGWSGAIEVLSYDDKLSASDVLNSRKGATAGVIFVASDQALLAPLVSDPVFDSLVTDVVGGAEVVLADKAMTAAMGDWFVANPDPTDDNYQDLSIASFRSDYAQIQPGLGIVSGATFEPRVTWDQRWGRLYGIAEEHPDTIVFGISEMTALVLEGDGATVAGERSVVALDARQATYVEGLDGGSFTALNVLLDVFAPGDTVQ